MIRDGGSVLLFGPQVLSFQEDSFHQLKSDILEDADNRRILDTVAQLPSYLEKLLERFPDFQVISGVKLLKDLNDWLTTGTFPSALSRLPNIILSPLVVLSQLTQYSKYLKLVNG